MSIPAAIIPSLVVQEQALTYNIYAASAFIIWDHIITLPQEIKVIWKFQLNPIDVLFFIIRYLTLASRIAWLIFDSNQAELIHPSNASCAQTLWVIALTGQIVYVAVEILLIIRVYAFYGRNNYLLGVLTAAFLATVGLEFAFIGVFVPRMTCLTLKVPNAFHNYFIPILVFEGILFILVIIKFLERKLVETGIDSPHLLVVFIRDGIWAFVLLFALLVWATLAFELSGMSMRGSNATTWLVPMFAFCGTRLTLNIRMAAEPEAAFPTMSSFHAYIPEASGIESSCTV